jgi:hypothetical protein
MSETAHLRIVITGLLGFAATKEEMLSPARAAAAQRLGTSGCGPPSPRSVDAL